MNPSAHHIAIVTGAGSGIGAAIAERLAHDGAKVMMNDIDEASVKAVKDKLISSGIAADHIAYQVGDVSHEGDMQALFARTLETYGELSLVVNNAGIIDNQR